MVVYRFGLAMVVALAAAGSCGADWELRRDDFDKLRPPVTEGCVNLTIGDPSSHFPRYLNELGIKHIRISFSESGGKRKRLSFIWSGGSQGPDRFAVTVDGVQAGESQAIDTARRPYARYRDDFTCKLKDGDQHVVEIASPEGFRSEIEFAGIRLSAPDAEPYQPLCYESVGSLERYEKELGSKGVLVKAAHLWVFAPADLAAEAAELAPLLEKAYGEMKNAYGIDPFFKFSVEHYPDGHERGWGGISGAGTIGYKTESLLRFAKLKTSDVRGFAGYTEEMSHGFNSHYACGGTYEALGVAVQEDVVRKLVPKEVADAFWLPEHRKWDETHKAYLGAGRRNPDPEKHPWGVLFTRILNDVFLKMRDEYGPRMWPDFYRAIREMDYPLHRAKDTERMGIYADIFTRLFSRDMRKEFAGYGIDLDADPPWGWETRGK